MNHETATEMTRGGGVSIPAAMEFLSVSRSKLYAMMADGTLQYLKIGERRVLLRADLERFLTERLLAR
ncbi:MAG: helix-turn-helix domain-containing protein [Gemmataceae bacterium]